MIEEAWKHFLNRERESHTNIDPGTKEFDK